MKRFMIEQGFKSNEEYTSGRLLEDRSAMQLMEVKYHHAGLRDAGFREMNGRLLYPDYKALSTTSMDTEPLTREAAVNAFRRLEAPQVVIAPLGIGNHIDHLIAREACGAAWPDAKVGYYFDFPYARNPLKYRLYLIRFLKGLKVSVKRFSEWKLELLSCYKSQMPFLFRGRPFYPEILFLPRIAAHF
jgi:LmbE family N-acetylglucosaminyl deacetylase